MSTVFETIIRINLANHCISSLYGVLSLYDLGEEQTNNYIRRIEPVLNDILNYEFKTPIQAELTKEESDNITIQLMDDLDLDNRVPPLGAEIIDHMYADSLSVVQAHPKLTSYVPDLNQSFYSFIESLIPMIAEFIPADAKEFFEEEGNTTVLSHVVPTVNMKITDDDAEEYWPTRNKSCFAGIVSKLDEINEFTVALYSQFMRNPDDIDFSDESM